MTEITMARIYIREQEHLLEQIVNYLKTDAQIRGFTVFRGISGYAGDSGKESSAKLIDLSLDLPLVVEFFDSSHKIEQVIHELQKIVKPEHIISWNAQAH